MSVIVSLKDNPALLYKYLEINHIQSAFVDYYGPRDWHVLLGDSKTRCGFFERAFRTCKGASEYAGNLNKLITHSLAAAHAEGD